MILSTLCYLTKDGKTLMLHRIKKPNDVHQGKWVGLGGKLEENESPDECVRREVQEEAGIQITDPKLRGIITFPEFTPNNTWHVFVYVAHDYTGSLCECNEGVLEWVPNERIHELNLWASDRVFLDWLYQRSDFFTAKFCDTKTDHFTYDVQFV